MLQANWKFINYVIHNEHSMTPKQLKKKPIKQIIKIEHGKLDTEEGYVISKTMVKSCIKHHCKIYSTSDGTYNILLMKVKMNVKIL